MFDTALVRPVEYLLPGKSSPFSVRSPVLVLHPREKTRVKSRIRQAQGLRRGVAGAYLKVIRKLGGIWEVLYGAAVELIADNGLVFASSIAFFAIFSLAPLLLLVIAITGLVFGEDQTRAEIQSQFGSR